MATKYDSSVNVLGNIPDYSSMIDFICEYCGRASEAPCQRLRSEARRRCGQEHRPTAESRLAEL